MQSVYQLIFLKNYFNADKSGNHIKEEKRIRL